jgi:hemoglobin
VDREAVSTSTVSDFRTPYEILGPEGIRALVDAFYEAMDTRPDAARIRAMHAVDLNPVKRRLAAWLTQWMGGPPVYVALEGSMCLHAAHAPYAIGPEERDLWLACMDEALSQIGASEALKTMLREPFRRVADAVRNRNDSVQRPRDPNLIAVG